MILQKMIKFSIFVLYFATLISSQKLDEYLLKNIHFRTRNNDSLIGEYQEVSCRSISFSQACQTGEGLDIAGCRYTSNCAELKCFDSDGDSSSLFADKVCEKQLGVNYGDKKYYLTKYDPVLVDSRLSPNLLYVELTKFETYESCDEYDIFVAQLDYYFDYYGEVNGRETYAPIFFPLKKGQCGMTAEQTTAVSVSVPIAVVAVSVGGFLMYRKHKKRRPNDSENGISDAPSDMNQTN